ncbi:MAG TPA: methyltransferase domain-containing protein [Roseiarcus sp.]
MTKSVSSAPERARIHPAGALIEAWRELGGEGAPLGAIPGVAEIVSLDLPEIVAQLDSNAIAARIAEWRTASPALNAVLLQNTPPAHALRRFGLTHWTAGNPRAASIVLATAAALAPNDAPLWLDLGFTLHAVGDAAQAQSALERALALDPSPARGWLGLALAARDLANTVRAEEAFKAALACDASLSEAAFGVGLLCFEQRRHPEAAAHWRHAIAHGCRNPLIYAGLGQSLFFAGDFAGAANALERQIASGQADPRMVDRFALSRFLTVAIRGDLDAAFAAYHEAAGPSADEAQMANSAFKILAGYGHPEAALRLARSPRAKIPDDPEHRYLIEAVAGAALDRAPAEYVIAHFDGFAERFDKQLVEVLGYRVPETLARLIAATRKSLPRALDLGCGTGLAGLHLRAGRSRLVGVDLSPRMLSKAADRQLYDSLVEADMIGFLETTTEQFDLVLAADAVIYLGDLDGFLSGAARVTRAGGLVAFNIETTAMAPYVLLSSGRFAHEIEALRAKAAAWFEVTRVEPAILRTEGPGRVQGALILLERR